ncbi:hypothetical protein SAMN05444411_102492 [Lutibacter oricola]|uniref:DUF2202 domain-containing protein n=1 Tax=Lutibacter oricola TaxID=762486 RepID=A0A1H2XJN0_9FLAO|nr:DUF2202 domain-containing protein [Lutibacter oricola]SDW93101.1 hypothetical protein SAMN05444411_102492 [Lutibacter oricola]
MKLLKINISVFLLLTLVLSCNSNSNSEDILDVEIIETTGNELNSTLSEEEIGDLLFLREEEKLARDVYLYAYSVYNTTIFKNIAASEQTHMDAILVLLNTYNIEDPILAEQGKFSNEILQNLYISLIEKCNISLLDALIVGNTIEDLDINDIELNENRTEKEDLLLVYASLKCGSRNHLRNFNNQLINNVGTYTPQYINQETFNNIIISENEKCGSN